MAVETSAPVKPRTTLPHDDGASGRGKWLALAAALLGWLFDGAEMGIFSMIGRQAVKDLLNTTDESLVGLWFSVITAGFLVGAATGGVLFGWLGDRIGRVRAMALSVLTYALFTGLCGLVGEAWQVGILRFIASVMKIPATATSLVDMRTADRIHFPLAPTSILVANPLRSTSSKKRAGGSGSS